MVALGVGRLLSKRMSATIFNKKQCDTTAQMHNFMPLEAYHLRRQEQTTPQNQQLDCLTHLRHILLQCTCHTPLWRAPHTMSQSSLKQQTTKTFSSQSSSYQRHFQPHYVRHVHPRRNYPSQGGFKVSIPGIKLSQPRLGTLHPSLALLSLKTNNLFEDTFTNTEGRIHVLTQADLTCQSVAISFSCWCPHFHSKAPHATDRLDFPIWVQIVYVCQVLKEDTFLKTIEEQIGQVITIDNSEAN